MVIDAAAFLHAFLGGMLIGTGALVLFLTLGRIAGISGILSAALNFMAAPDSGQGGVRRFWPIVFLLGLAGAAPAGIAAGWGWIAPPPDHHPFSLIAAGLMVGYGTRLGSGCTSGHAVCGIARFSVRSIIATAIFMATAALVVFTRRHLLGI